MAIRFLLALACGLGLAAAASASPGGTAWLSDRETSRDGVQSVRVDLSGLDLATADGADTLRDRVRRAALLVCDGPLPDDVSYLYQVRARVACRRDTIRSAENQVATLVARARSGVRLSVVTLQSPSSAR